MAAGGRLALPGRVCRHGAARTTWACDSSGFSLLLPQVNMSCSCCPRAWLPFPRGAKFTSVWQPQESSGGWGGGGQRVARVPGHGSEAEMDCVGRTVFRILQQPLFSVFN